MRKNDADIYVENQNLKNEFKELNLPLDEVMEFVPYNLQMENNRLRNLLDYAKEYQKHKSQKLMELINKPFPPIFPQISPENDWERFELWIEGKPTIQKVKDRLPKGYEFPPSESLSDDELFLKIGEIKALLAKTGYFIGLNDNLPTRLTYANLIESMEEEDFLGDGWHHDGCSGYCPGCIQRPWCEQGNTGMWKEDEDLGKMCLVPELEPYVSALPQAIEWMKKEQEEEDQEYEEFRKEIREERLENPDNEWNLPKTGNELFDLSDN